MGEWRLNAVTPNSSRALTRYQAISGRRGLMRIPRLYLETPLEAGLEVELDERGCHYIHQVLRLKTGAPLVLFNGAEGEFSAYLSYTSQRSSRAYVEAFHPCGRESRLAITLYQGISKGDRMDLALQKSTELGMSAIVPVMTARSAARLTGGTRLERKQGHWRGILASACEQSGRTRLPVLGDVIAIDDLPRLKDGECGLVLNGRAEQTLTAAAPPEAGDLSILIGPEGGLTEAEIHESVQLSYQAVRLGPRTLRTETAAVAALTAAQLLWGDL